MFSFKPGISRRNLLLLAFAASQARLYPALADSPRSDIGDTPDIPFLNTLFYKPKEGFLWDTWTHYHDGTFFLYYLYAPDPKKYHTQIALATSRDGVHWTEHGKVLEAEAGTIFGSGTVWAVPDQSGQKKRFLMNYSVGQRIFFAESSDLYQWKPLGESFEMHRDPRWYETGSSGRWDGIAAVPRPGGGFYGYWTATAKGKKNCMGFGESDDGIRWRVQEPVPISGIVYSPITSTEISGVHFSRGKYYAMGGLNDLRTCIADLYFGPFLPGVTTLVAESPKGPFQPAAKNRRLIVGNAMYWGRFVETPDGLLVNHQSWELSPFQWQPWLPTVPTYMAPMKRAVWDDEGTLRLHWWKGNDIAKKVRVDTGLADNAGDAKIRYFNAPLPPDKLLILEGEMKLSGAPAQQIGLFLAGAEETGTAFLVQPDGVVEYGNLRNDASDFQKRGAVDREMAMGSSARFRLLRKGRLTEFYLNDVLMQVYSLTEDGTGQLGLLGPASHFSKLALWNS